MYVCVCEERQEALVRVEDPSRYEQTTETDTATKTEASTFMRTPQHRQPDSTPVFRLHIREDILNKIFQTLKTKFEQNHGSSICCHFFNMEKQVAGTFFSVFCSWPISLRTKKKILIERVLSAKQTSLPDPTRGMLWQEVSLRLMFQDTDTKIVTALLHYEHSNV